VYLWRPLRFEERHGILSLGAPQIRLCLFLTRPYPGRVVPLGDPDARVPEQNRNSFEWNSSQEQLYREGVAEAMPMSVRQFCFFEEFLYLGLPVAVCSFASPAQKK
jgi:hypothetical protein